MGTTIDIKPLTIAELREVAEAAGVKDVPEKPKPKVVEAVAAGITDEQAQAALVKYGYEDAPAAPPAPDASSDDNDPTAAPTGAAPDGLAPSDVLGDNAGAPAVGDPTPLGPEAVLEDEFDDDLESDGVVPAAGPVALPRLEGKHLPKLKQAGATIKRIARHTDGNGGEDPGSWWCPFTDYSKLKEGETVDQMPQSRAIRVVSAKLEDRPAGGGQRNVEYAVVLPPQGVPAGLLN